MIGQTLGRFRIVDAIGSGAMGVVYRAHDPSLDRDVALKVLHPHVLESEAARQRFVGEALALSHLNHPHICSIYEIGDAGGQTFIVMEYVKGHALSSVIPSDGLSVETMVRYGREIAEALAHAHQHGIVHRDLKSANVVITPEGRAKVLDFGLAKHTDASLRSAALTQPVVTETGVVMGTPAYMAPEVLAGAPADARADVWALGVILYEMGTGQRPFIGRTTIELAAAIARDSPAALPAHVPMALRGVVRRCVAKEPARRYQSGGEVRAALEAAVPEQVAVVRPARPVTRRPVAWVLASVVVVALLVTLAATMGMWPTRSPGGPIRSVAVLPLENLSGDPEQEYFVDGMTEQLTADLSKIGRLRVISRTSAMQYKKARKPLPVIARELNVDAILEGSVVRAGDKVRITAKLVRGTTDENLWAQSYERDLRDILALQGEVARSIASEIGIRLTPQEEARLASARRVDPAVHQLYLLGRYHLGRSSRDGLQKAIQYFEQVIAKDPGNAAGHVGLAEAYIQLSQIFSDVPPRDVMPKAKASATKAVMLEESLADAHASLGFIHLFYDWDGPAAEREFQRAIQLNPSLAIAHLYYAQYLLVMRRQDEAVAEVRRALDLDPLSLGTYAYGTLLFTFARRYDEAIALAHRALDLNPRFGTALVFQGLAYAEQGRFPEAVSNLQKALQLDRGVRTLVLGAHVHAVAGRKGEAENLIKEGERIAGEGYFCPYEVALAHISLGNHDKAYAWFKKGVEARADCMALLHVEPWVEPFRADPRYAQLLDAVGLAPREVAKPIR